MDWDQFRFVLAIARGGSLSAAGRSLGVDQSTASRRLAMLERRLGTELFIRARPSFIPTQSGEMVITHAERMETEALGVVEKLNEKDFRPQGLVRIATMPWIVTSLIIPAMPEYSARYPGIEIETIGDVRERSLSSREAEIALRFEMQAHHREIAITVAAVPYALYGPSDSDADELPWIGFGEDVANSDPAQWVERARSSLGRVAMRAHDAGFVHAAIRAGLGKGLIPQFLAQNDHSDIVRLSGPDPEIVRNLRILVHEDMRRIARTVTVIEWLRESISRRMSEAP